MAGDDDAAALERVLAGDRGAFDEIVKRHERGIRALVFRYLRNDEDAKDVAQQAFSRAFEKLDSFRRDSSFHTWLYRIAVNLALNHRRSRGDEVPLPPDDLPAFTHSLKTSRLVAADVWRKVGARLETLPPMQRLAVELRSFHDLSFREIAAIADCSEESAKANYHHGVRALRDILT